MPEDVEVETDKLREQADDAREQAHEAAPKWFRYVGLSAAFFAVLAAVSSLRAADLINEATINQIKASDTWAEYQAARAKEHMYTIATDSLIDRGSKNVALLRLYRAQVSREAAKEKPLAASARGLEDDSTAEIRRHHSFENAVALLQVGIALGAVAALARSMPAWYISLAAGVVGFIFFLRGFTL